MTTALVLDANSLVKRCIMASALDDLKSGTTFTGGVYGTLNTLRSILELPEAWTIGPLVAFFDGGISAKRLELLPDYKSARADRKKLLSDEDKEKAFAQMGLVEEMLPLLGFRTRRYEATEADDCVVAAARMFLQHDVHVTVVTGDKDLWQAVRFGADVWDLNQKRFVEQGNFGAVAGVSVAAYVVYRALVGDHSDSIAGCPGCGPVRASELIIEATERFADFESLAPADQLSRLRLLAVTRKPKPRKFEQSLFSNFDYLQRVIKAIDLKESFDHPLEELRAWISESPVAVNKMGFLRFCKRVGFRSVLSYPDRFLKPFERCAEKANTCALPGEKS